jgi:DNA-binding HxlR family transcriptional regulator
MGKVPESASCSIERSLGVLGERWSFLILREAFLGATKFVEFRDRLGVAPDVLSDRLSTLVEYGVMDRTAYQEPGTRSRFAYRLTTAGLEVAVVLSALQQWGDKYLPRPEGPSMLRRIRGTDLPVHVGYVDDQGNEVPTGDVAVIPADPLDLNLVRLPRDEHHRRRLLPPGLRLVRLQEPQAPWSAVHGLRGPGGERPSSRSQNEVRTSLIKVRFLRP